jgi:hypothetical protein
VKEKIFIIAVYKTDLYWSLPCRGGSRCGFMELLGNTVGTAIFNFHGDFGKKVGNYNLTSL